MKSHSVILTVGCMILGLSGSASASLVIYNFEGRVTSLSRDAHIVDGLIAVGDNVGFTFHVDLDLPGTQERYNGQFIERVDHDNEGEKVDYFWTEYVGGSDIGPIGEITSPDPNFFETTNYGLSVNRKVNGAIVQDTGYLYGGSTYNWVSIENYSQNVQAWKSGNSGFQFRHIVWNQEGEDTWIRGSATLVSESSLSAVPEPATVILGMTLGLIGFVSIRSRFGALKAWVLGRDA